ncbi:hypothetical protein KSP40_PGU012533 [Platanthera guangdongensis]|uniref:Eukaryotic translation initiation factor-related n=1 Tax=Platanthera guangdongensis TaxID=2320717 RepID=A0ABR2LWC9_9ASPA
MSKKKFSAGSMTMTLKDFHGGAIPSDLLLPSAPGVTARPPDRPSAWVGPPIPAGASTGIRAEHHRPRPGSSGGIPRVLDERGPAFLSSTSFIGRHFDEDERKPFEASSGPRRPSMAVVEATRSPLITAAQASAPSDPKRPVSSPVVAHHLSPSPGVSTTSAGNAWAAKREAQFKGGAGAEPSQTQPSATLSGSAAASRFAQASAIEKVTSGRWQSKPADVEVIRFQEMEIFDGKDGERSLVGNVEEGSAGRTFSYSGMKERRFGGLPSDGRHQERVISPLYPEIKETNVLGFQSNSSRPISCEGSSALSPYQQSLDDASERPKLKLLPRTKPLEPSDAKILDGKQGYLYSTSLKHTEEAQEMHGALGKVKLGAVGVDAMNRPVERPKLNLKPRSQPIEQQDEIFERERKTVFGGARPRELVLKERDIDAADNPEITAQVHRAKSDVLKIEPKLEQRAVSSFNRATHEAAESSPAERRNSRDPERRDNLINQETLDAKYSWRNGSRRNPKEMEKKPVEAERPPEPETWRKPVEPPKPDTPPGSRVARASSALELAQAFSRSMSDSRVDNHYTKQSVLPGRTQMPFSRLTGSREISSGSTHRHINGY